MNLHYKQLLKEVGREKKKRYGLNLGQLPIEIGTNDSEDSCYIRKIRVRRKEFSDTCYALKCIYLERLS